MSDIKQQMIEIAHLIYGRFLSDSAGGNISVRHEGRIYVSPRFMGSIYRYQITPEQILDIDKTPLGKEDKKAAPLENILSIQYERLGVLGLILNFGTVYITVGGTKFTFDYVYNPSEVQQDVFRRMAERVARKRKSEAESERERVSEWFVSYYNVMKDEPNLLYHQLPFLNGMDLGQGPVGPGDNGEDLEDFSGDFPTEYPGAPEY